MTRAVLYARVSGDDRNNSTSSLDSQIELCRTYANENGWEVVAEAKRRRTRGQRSKLGFTTNQPCNRNGQVW